MAEPPAPLLEVAGLHIAFGTDVPAVVDVGFALAAGETLCLVGESGSGKSLTALALLGLLGDLSGRVRAERLTLAGVDLRELAEPAWRGIRGRRIALVFQDPLTALNPYLRIGDQMVEGLAIHGLAHGKAAREQAVSGLREVALPNAEAYLARYPHELSGGQRQRVAIAQALLCAPQVLVADEPTTALDVTIQAQVLALLQRVQRHRQMGLLLITHDMGVVAQMADRVVVLYSGMVQEVAPVRALFGGPRHPYTAGLLASRPGVQRRGQRLRAIAGLPPQPEDRLRGCAFAPRCPLANQRCAAELPPLVPVGDVPGHLARCWRSDELQGHFQAIADV